MRLVLASASPRRAELLRAAGLEFDVAPAGIDEARLPAEAPDIYVARVASDKAALVAARHPGRVVLAADTEVVVDGDVLGKPAGAADAARMLRRLANRVHVVMTGVVVRQDARALSAVEISRVAMRDLSDRDIAWYVDSGEPFDKAGGYAIQGLAARFCQVVDGGHDNVVGLPIACVRRLLAALVPAAPSQPGEN